MLAIIETQRFINAAALDPDHVMRVVAERAQAITGAAAAVVEMVDGDEMVYRTASGTAYAAIGTRVEITGSLEGLCVRTERAMRCDDTRLDPRVNQKACDVAGVRSMIVVPLIQDRRPVGVLEVLSPEPGSFDDDDVDTLESMAGFISASLVHASVHQEQSYRASHDMLTDLPNRARFVHGLEDALEDCARNGTTVTVFFVDLDGFKAVNDTYGHAAGDRLLQAVASELRARLRDTDTVARYGGDEFVILCDPADTAAIATVSERVHEAVAAAVQSTCVDIPVTASIGAASAGCERSVEDLLAAADQSMYSMKRSATRRNQAV